jgi:hypothetical protein
VQSTRLKERWQNEAFTSDYQETPGYGKIQPDEGNR